MFTSRTLGYPSSDVPARWVNELGYSEKSGGNHKKSPGHQYQSSEHAGERPVIHSDRGGHYRWPGWLERVNAAGLIRSMSRKGCSPDNAACEGFFGRLKTECIMGVNGRASRQKSSCSKWMLASDGITSGV